MNVDKIKGNLIVSCQALEDEPLHSPYIMSKMALAAKVGGARGIRANGVEDIKAIKSEVDLPIIGIIKRDYKDSDVFITATMKEVDALVEVGVDIIALDATSRPRPNGLDLKSFVEEIKKNYPTQLLMADISSYEEAKEAVELGFDFVGPTLVGYTDYTRGIKIDTDDFALLRSIIDLGVATIAEGNIDTPQKAKRVLDLGAYSVVTGGAITRPQLITKKFVDTMREERYV